MASSSTLTDISASFVTNCGNRQDSCSISSERVIEKGYSIGEPILPKTLPLKKFARSQRLIFLVRRYTAHWRQFFSGSQWSRKGATMSGALSIALTGMAAASAGMRVTSNNIANQGVEGYARQRLDQTTAIAVNSGGLSMGQGTQVTAVERLFSASLTSQVLSAKSELAATEAYASQINQIDNMLAHSGANLSNAIQSYFSTTQTVVADPSSTAARQTMAASAENVATQFQSAYSQLDAINSSVNQSISAAVEQVNSYTSQIAGVNKQIMTTGGSNSLLDQRDKLVSQLSQYVKITESGTGSSYRLATGSGQTLVSSQQAHALGTKKNADDPSRLTVGLQTASGISGIPESQLQGGTLGGLLNLQSGALDTAYNKLGQLATSFGQTVNSQQELGQDLMGNTAGSGAFARTLFNVAEPTVAASTNNSAGSPAVTAHLTVPRDTEGHFASDLKDSDYQLAADSSGTLTLTRLSDKRTWTGATIASLNTALDADPQGFKLNADQASFAAGDNYLIQPTRHGAKGISANSAITANPALVAAGGPISATAANSNTGTLQAKAAVAPGYAAATLSGGLALAVNASGISGFPAGAVTVTNGNGRTSYPITGPSDVVPYTAGATYSIAATSGDPRGVAVTLTGAAPATGTDTITLDRSTATKSDGSNLQRIANLQQQATTNGQTFQQSYAELVSNIGAKAQSVANHQATQTAVLEQAVSARDALSGVNLDEEAANLIKYQQAYQAAAKIIQIDQQMFDSLLQAVN